MFGGAGSEWGGTGWYLVVLGQYNLVLLGIKWNQVIARLLCLYILKKLQKDSLPSLSYVGYQDLPIDICS